MIVFEITFYQQWLNFTILYYLIDYSDDKIIIPRNTSIVVRRVPTKPGKGTAQRYIEGVGPRNVAFNKPGWTNTSAVRPNGYCNL